LGHWFLLAFAADQGGAGGLAYLRRPRLSLSGYLLPVTGQQAAKRLD